MILVNVQDSFKLILMNIWIHMNYQDIYRINDFIKSYLDQCILPLIRWDNGNYIVLFYINNEWF